MALFSSDMLFRLPGALYPARYYDTPGTRLRSANTARSIIAVGAPFSPSAVAYILQPSAYSVRSSTGNRSSPSTLIVGLPGNASLLATSSVLTATSSTSASRPSSSRTSRKVFSASRYVGHPSKYRISICIALRFLDASWRTYTIAPYAPTPVAVPIQRSAWKGYSQKFAALAHSWRSPESEIHNSEDRVSNHHPRHSQEPREPDSEEEPDERVSGHERYSTPPGQHTPIDGHDS